MDLIFNINTELSAVCYSQTPIQTPFIWPEGVKVTQTTYRCRPSVLEHTDKQGQKDMLSSLFTTLAFIQTGSLEPFLFEPSLRLGKGFVSIVKNNYNNNDI